MNQDLGLRVLSRIMRWTDSRARDEFAWLKLMARLKYDGYRDFQAGMRFIESLVTWLQQFQEDEREIAYTFVRHSLVFIGPSEMQRLVEQFYPRFVQARIMRMAANANGVSRYRMLVDPAGQAACRRLRRQTLFMGLSDGARIDTIRHANSGVLGNEQFVQGTQVDTDKWKDLIESLREDLKDASARFRIVYLVDDFTATGTSFLRFDGAALKWKGKLVRFKDSLSLAQGTLRDYKLFEADSTLCVHHHLASSAAVGAIKERIEKYDKTQQSREDRLAQTSPTFGMVLPDDLPIHVGDDNDFVGLTQTYYDPILRTKHTDIGGVTHLGLGYGGCALPLGKV